ncbi:Phosphatidylinositol-4-phosphate 5-kinase, N-terminal domain [Phytophthora cactorum]|nr:Phosphatidylinositol-4-phosphate 5-kinase, N-terminal domain [Phytophthora cactorum]
MDNSSTISSSSGNYIDAMSLNNNMSATAQQPLISTPRATQKNIVRVIDKDMTQQFRGRSKSVGQGRIRWFENRKSQLLGFCLTMAFLGVSVAMYNYRWTGLIAGSVNTIICGSAVVITYCRKKQWHQHPNPIVHNRSVLSIFMAICLLLNVLVDFNPSGSNTDCQRLAGITEFFFFTGEAWGLVMACDLFFSLTSPFTSYKRLMKFYHLWVWLGGITMGVITYAVQGAGGFFTVDGQSMTYNSDTDTVIEMALDFDLRLCASGAVCVCMVSLLTVFTSIFGCIGYSTNLFRLIFSVLTLAWHRLYLRGVPKTYNIRLRVLNYISFFTGAYVFYWLLLLLLYMCAYFLSTKSDTSNSKAVAQVLRQLVIFLISSKGYLDYVIWFAVNNIERKGGNGHDESADVDVDLSPQVNTALRSEILYYTTSGIKESVRAVTDELISIPISGESEAGKSIKFWSFCPASFRNIRLTFGISDADYIQMFGATTKERFSEGRSGAFMFYTSDESLIVKTMSPEECAFLRKIAPNYEAYMSSNPDTLLTRFYGCHSVSLYGKMYYFVVMGNLFADTDVVHHRYDIKGSWVDRNAKVPSPGDKTACRYCNASYTFGSTKNQECGDGMNFHEPDIVLKDNDLMTKIRIDPATAHRIYDQIHKDSDFLCSQGIMDYSLLMGIQSSEYFVDTSQLPQARRDLLFTQPATSVAGPSLYHFGIIDFLQQWYVIILSVFFLVWYQFDNLLMFFCRYRTLEKKMERFYKTFVKRKDPEGVSALPPKPYKFRFQQKMSRIFALSTHTRAENDTAFNHNYPALIDVLDQGNFDTQRHHNTFVNNSVVDQWSDQRPVFNPDLQQDIRAVSGLVLANQDIPHSSQFPLTTKVPTALNMVKVRLHLSYYASIQHTGILFVAERAHPVDGLGLSLRCCQQLAQGTDGPPCDAGQHRAGAAHVRRSCRRRVKWPNVLLEMSYARCLSEYDSLYRIILEVDTPSISNRVLMRVRHFVLPYSFYCADEPYLFCTDQGIDNEVPMAELTISQVGVRFGSRAVLALFPQLDGILRATLNVLFLLLSILLPVHVPVVLLFDHGDKCRVPSQYVCHRFDIKPFNSSYSDKSKLLLVKTFSEACHFPFVKAPLTSVEAVADHGGKPGEGEHAWTGAGETLGRFVLCLGYFTQRKLRRELTVQYSRNGIWVNADRVGKGASVTLGNGYTIHFTKPGTTPADESFEATQLDVPLELPAAPPSPSEKKRKREDEEPAAVTVAKQELERKLKATESQLKATQSKLKSAKAQTETLREELEQNVRLKVDKLAQENLNLMSKLEIKETMKKSMEAASKENQSLKEELVAKDKAMGLKIKEAVKKSIEADKEKKTQEMATKLKEATKKYQQKVEAEHFEQRREMSEKMAAYANENEKLQTTLSTKEEELTECEDKIARLRKKVGTLEETTSNLTEQEKQMEEYEEKITVLEENIKTLTAKEKKLAECEEKVAELEEKINASKDENSEILGLLAAAEEKVIAAENEATEATIAAAAAKVDATERQELRDSIKSLRSELETIAPDDDAEALRSRLAAALNLMNQVQALSLQGVSLITGTNNPELGDLHLLSVASAHTSTAVPNSPSSSPTEEAQQNDEDDPQDLPVNPEVIAARKLAAKEVPSKKDQIEDAVNGAAEPKSSPLQLKREKKRAFKQAAPLSAAIEANAASAIAAMALANSSGKSSPSDASTAAVKCDGEGDWEMLDLALPDRDCKCFCRSFEAPKMVISTNQRCRACFCHIFIQQTAAWCGDCRSNRDSPLNPNKFVMLRTAFRLRSALPAQRRVAACVSRSFSSYPHHEVIGLPCTSQKPEMSDLYFIDTTII